MLVALNDHWVCMHHNACHSDELALASWCVYYMYSCAGMPLWTVTRRW